MRAWWTLAILLISGCAGTSEPDASQGSEPLFNDVENATSMDPSTLLESDITAPGLFLQFQVSSPIACTLEIVAARQGSDAGPSSLSVSRQGDEYNGWSMGSTGDLARVQAAGLDTHDVLTSSGWSVARWAIEVPEEPVWVTVARHGLAPVDHEWTDGHSLRITHDCDLNVTDLRGGTNVVLTNHERMKAAAQAQAQASLVRYGAMVEGTVGQTFDGPIIVLADAFSDTLIDATLDHPTGSDSILWLPEQYAPMFAHEGGPGDYTWTMNKADAGPIFNTMWLLMAQADPMESFADLES